MVCSQTLSGVEIRPPPQPGLGHAFPLPPPEVPRPPPALWGGPCPTPLLPPLPAQARWTGVWITCRRLSEACGLSSSSRTMPSGRTTDLVPSGEVTDAQNKTCAVPPLTSAPALWLGPFMGEHLPKAEATERAATLLCWPSRATAGLGAGVAPQSSRARARGGWQLPGARGPRAEQGRVCTGASSPSPSPAQGQGRVVPNVPSP